MIKKGRKKHEFTLPHTCSPFFPETDFPGFLAIWFCCFQTQGTTVAMKGSGRCVLAVLLCPSISMYTQELTGGRGREEGDRKKGAREGGRKREKMLKYLRYKIRRP